MFLTEGVRAGAGTLIQVTGGSARRAMPGRGLWAAGAAATRAIVHAAAQELRAEGIHVALLIVDATIDSPKTARVHRRPARERERRQAEIARAVEYLAGQSPRAFTHELVVTPAGDRWVPVVPRGTSLTISNASSTADNANRRWTAAGPRTSTSR